MDNLRRETLKLCLSPPRAGASRSHPQGHRQLEPIPMLGFLARRRARRHPHSTQGLLRHLYISLELHSSSTCFLWGI